MKFVIYGEVPAKKNSRIFNRKTGLNFPSKRYKEWHDMAKVQIPNISTIKNPCKLSLVFIHGDKRRRDSDNGTSSVLDLLIDCKVLKDDCWEIVQEISIKNGYEKNKARCEIEIEEL